MYNYDDYLRSKFYFNLTLLTGVIALKPLKIDPIGPERKKSSCFFRVKSRTANTQKLKLAIQNVQMDGLVIGYVKISDGSL